MTAQSSSSNIGRRLSFPEKSREGTASAFVLNGGAATEIVSDWFCRVTGTIAVPLHQEPDANLWSPGLLQCVGVLRVKLAQKSCAPVRSCQLSLRALQVISAASVRPKRASHALFVQMFQRTPVFLVILLQLGFRVLIGLELMTGQHHRLITAIHQHARRLTANHVDDNCPCHGG